MTSPTLRVCALYPELMNIYADRGNIAVLRARCEWRGLGFEHAASSVGEPLDESAHDLFYMGGGQDRDDGPRLIGNCAIEADLGNGPQTIAGFENHGGRTYLGADEQPLGRVLSGHGNNGKDGHEGVHSHNVIGTYLHGPLLPKNVWLADRLIELALGVELGPLDDRIEDAAHASARRAAAV